MLYKLQIVGTVSAVLLLMVRLIFNVCVAMKWFANKVNECVLMALSMVSGPMGSIFFVNV